MTFTIVFIVLLAIVLVSNWVFDKLWERRYAAHIIRFWDGTYGVRRRWLDNGFEFLGKFPLVDSYWWFASASDERVGHFATVDDARAYLASYEAEQLKRTSVRKSIGGERVK